jgi:hypothetical protein
MLRYKVLHVSLLDEKGKARRLEKTRGKRNRVIGICGIGGAAVLAKATGARRNKSFIFYRNKDMNSL